MPMESFSESKPGFFGKIKGLFKKKS